MQRVGDFDALTGGTSQSAAAAIERAPESVSAAPAMPATGLPQTSSAVMRSSFDAMLVKALSESPVGGSTSSFSASTDPATGLPLLEVDGLGAVSYQGANGGMGMGVPAMGAYGAPGASMPGAAMGGYGMPTGMMPGTTMGAYGMTGSMMPMMPYGAFAPGAVGMPFGYPGGSPGMTMVAMAQREVGQRESPPGSNNSERIAMYRTATAGAADTPGPWCAYFVSWLAKGAGAPVGDSGQGIGYVPTLEAWGKSSGRFFANGAMPPQPGDIVIFNRGGGVSDHTGIVEFVGSDGTVNTIEGNSSDMVARRHYPASEATIIGFVRP